MDLVTQNQISMTRSMIPVTLNLGFGDPKTDPGDPKHDFCDPGT